MRIRSRVISLLAGFLFVGCAGTPFTDNLSYGQAQTLQAGLSADWVLAEYPFGRADRRPNGTVERIRYPVRDPHGSNQTLDLFFDEKEILRSRRYSGPVLRTEVP